MAVDDETEVRNTRFTMDVLELAAERYDAVKDRFRESAGGEESIGAAILADLGWSSLALEQFAEGTVEQICMAFGLDPGRRTLDALWTTVADSMAMGAICADVTYERDLGLL